VTWAAAVLNADFLKAPATRKTQGQTADYSWGVIVVHHDTLVLHEFCK
jgi:hypothetical protein